MVQSTQVRSLQLFICRSCRQTLSQSLRQTRQFSNSATRSKVIPSFTLTSNAELDAILLDWRQRVFTPSALSKHHQDLIHRKKYKQLLENESGVTIAMSDGEEVKLQPSDRWNRPQFEPGLNDIIKLLQAESGNAQAWENLIPFLEGLKMSGYKIPRHLFEKITRKAVLAGRPGIVRRGAEMVSRTGLKLSYEGVAREMMIGYHNRAIESLNQPDGTKDSDILKEAQSLVVLMGSNAHCGGSLAGEERDMRNDPLVLGTMLELAALKTRATSSSTTSDTPQDTVTPELLTSYAKRLAALGTNINIVTKPSIATKKGNYHLAAQVEASIIIAHGIKMALALPVETLQITQQERKSLHSAMTSLNASVNRDVPKIKKIGTGQTRSQALMEQIQKADKQQ